MRSAAKPTGPILVAAMVASALHCAAAAPPADPTSKPDPAKDASTIDVAPTDAGAPSTSAASTDAATAVPVAADAQAADDQKENENNALTRLMRLAEEQRKRVAAAKAEVKRLKTLAIESKELAERKDASTQVAPAEQALTDEQAKLVALDNAVAAERSSETPHVVAANPTNQTALEFKYGTRLHYGPTLSVLKYTVTRPADEPGRLRNYSPELALVPLELGFQFVVEPANRPWRYVRKDGKDFQVMSPGGMLLVRVSDKELAQGAIALAATLSFFDNTIGLGLGFDLYRGIPVQGPDGRAGGSTAYTGILPWAFAKEGEVTPENLFVVITLGLAPVVRSVTGDVK